MGQRTFKRATYNLFLVCSFCRCRTAPMQSFANTLPRSWNDLKMTLPVIFFPPSYHEEKFLILFINGVTSYTYFSSHCKANLHKGNFFCVSRHLAILVISKPWLCPYIYTMSFWISCAWQWTKIAWFLCILLRMHRFEIKEDKSVVCRCIANIS